jgi:hypothetical protein
MREIHRADDPALRAAHQLLRHEFPHAEVLPLRDWRNAIRERRSGLWTDITWHLLVAMRGDTVVAVSSGSYLGNVNVGVIGYVAVRPAERAAGLGPRLRRALRRRFERDARAIRRRPLEGIVGEVREDNPWLRTLVRREGAIALDFDYFQPSLGSHAKPVPLVFYYQPLARKRKSIRGDELRKLLYTLWRRSYRVPKPLSRAEFRRMLRSFEGRQRVGQRVLKSRQRAIPQTQVTSDSS